MSKKPIKVAPLDKNYKRISQDLYDYIEEKLDPLRKRHKYIVSTILKTFGAKYKSIGYEFSTVDSADMVDSDSVFFHYTNGSHTKTNYPPKVIIDKIEYYLSESYPSRWLFQDFEPELQKIHDTWVQEQKQNKVKTNQDNKKLQSLKKKLSPEEFEFITSKMKK